MAAWIEAGPIRGNAPTLESHVFRPRDTCVVGHWRAINARGDGVDVWASDGGGYVAFAGLARGRGETPEAAVAALRVGE